MPTQFVDYRLVKKTVSIEQILNRYGLMEKLRGSGDSRSGPCPIHGGHDISQFRVSLKKNCWNCFGKCHRGGNTIDFVALKEGISFREGALRIQEWFGVISTPAARAETKGEQKEESKPVEPPKPTTTRNEEKPDVGEGESGENKPLGFELKLEPAHPYLSERKITSATIAAFGLGYCGKGTMAGRIAIPIYNAKKGGGLVGYVGRWPGEPPADTPRYKLPTGFRKSLEVFNLYSAMNRVANQDAPALIVVEGFFDCIWMWQLGYPVVSIMGSSLSEAQATLLVQHLGPRGRVTLLFDEDAAGREGRAQALSRLVNHLFVRVLPLPKEGQQPDHLGEDELSALLSGTGSTHV